MKIRNIEVDFDFLDADDIERFENEAKRLLNKCDEEVKKDYSSSETIKVQCRIIEEFIDNVFGEGLSEKIFIKRNNLKEHLEIYEEIIKEKQQENSEMQNKFGKYQPNREQRRYDKFDKGRR